MEKDPLESNESWSAYEDRMIKLKQNEIERIKVENDQTRKLHKKSKVKRETIHGIMIDAGSRGTRLHVYEFYPRVLDDAEDVQEVVAGRKLSLPTSGRWTNRLRPGIASLSDFGDDDIVQAVAEYMQPMMDFAQKTLRTKEEQYSDFPIFFKATAGMRVLEKEGRSRIIGGIRTLFANKTYCPFLFATEQARVLSGEEEAIYGWTAINFLLGAVVQDSEGAGTANPKKTYGALDMGGASTQISFFEPDGDIMSNLFKLQIGQGKHWNIYAHSFLYYGIVEATARFQARIAAGKTPTERLIDGVYNPCLPGGSQQEVRTAIHLDDNMLETWSYDKQASPSGDGFYQIVFKNEREGGNFDQCMELTYSLLHIKQNDWCNFAHRNYCSFAGIYQPDLPRQSESFGEFLAFSNYYHVWDFLKLPSRSTIGELREQTRIVCSMSSKEVRDFNDGRIDEDELDDYCFRSVYVYQLLRNGYGFNDDDYITSMDVIGGEKVGWPLGSMLYEINLLPWVYDDPRLMDSSSSDSISSDSADSASYSNDYNSSEILSSSKISSVKQAEAFSDLLPTSQMDYAHKSAAMVIFAISTIVAVSTLSLSYSRDRRRRARYYEYITNSDV